MLDFRVFWANSSIVTLILPLLFRSSAESQEEVDRNAADFSGSRVDVVALVQAYSASQPRMAKLQQQQQRQHNLRVLCR